jgi:outer membrane protein assembly factor BamB
MRSWLVGCSVSLAALVASAGETWPELRGPRGNGHAEAHGLPLTWSESENIVWKTAIHDRGWSSPVIGQDQIWLTTATADGKQMFAVGVDRATGRVLHDVQVFDNDKLDHIAEVNSYASPTPVVEAGRVYVHYGTYGTAGLDTQTGQILWTRRDLHCDHHEGPGSSPILFENLLIFHVDGRDVQYVVALDKATGRTVWKTNRSIDYSQYHFNTRKGFCTPAVIDVGGRPQLVSPAAKAVFGYDPRTGQELWQVRYNGWSMVPRPLYGHGLAFVSTDYERPELWAIRPDGQGDVTSTHVAWAIKRGMPAKPSALLIGNLLYVGNDEGILHCVEAKTGDLVWKERLRGNYSASPLYADGHLYFFNQDSITTVVEPGRQCQILAVNELSGEQLMASPAAAGKALFIRTRTQLYRIEKKGS